MESVAIGRDGAGVYAMTLTCTHAGCDIVQSGGKTDPSGLTCGCHGSTFDANGLVTGGQATRPLDHYKVAIDGAGDITVDTNTTVDSSVRLAVE